MTEIIAELGFAKMRNEQVLESQSKSEKKFRALIEQSITGIYIFSKDKYIYVNQKFCDIFGYSEDEILSTLKPADVIEQQDQHVTQKHISNRLSGKVDSVHYVVKGNRKDRKELWVEIHGTHIELDGEQVITGTVLDITAKHKSARAIEQSEAKFRTVFESSNVGKSITLPTGEVNVNQAFADMLGYSKKELNNKRWQELTPKDEIERIEAILNPLLNGKTRAARFVKPYFHKDGSIVWADLSLALHMDSQKKPLFFISTIVDITEQMHVQEVLDYKNELLREMGKTASIGAWEYDPVNGCTAWTDEILSILDLEAGTNPDLDLTKSLYTEESLAQLENAFQRALLEKKPFSLELEIVTQKGRRKWIRNLGKPVVDTNGTVKLRGSMQDISDKKKIEQEILHLNKELELRVKQRTEQLEAVNKELETFTYSVSHDLKAPLRGIDGYGKLLVDLYKEELSEEAKLFVNNIRNSTNKMNLLIDDLLDYSRLERKLFRNDRIQLKSFISSIVESFKSDFDLNKDTINIDIPDIQIIADSKGLTIAIRNVIENAIKFTRNKEIPQISISCIDQETSWILKIADNGIGFDMKYHNKIFEIFQRLHRVEEYPGTGVGLAMVSKTMHRMNGKAYAESVLNEGSAFYLEIPKTTTRE